jgi:hypothetical protein
MNPSSPQTTPKKLLFTLKTFNNLISVMTSQHQQPQHPSLIKEIFSGGASKALSQVHPQNEIFMADDISDGGILSAIFYCALNLVYIQLP